MNILVALLLSVTAYTGTYTEGLHAYENEHYTQAIDSFETLVYNRVYEAEVFYNLGNAYYRLDDMPAAILHYERALHIDPSLRVAHDNLAQAVAQTQQQLARPAPQGLESTLYFWHHSLRSSSSLRVAMACWLLLWASLIARSIRPRPYLRRIAVACGLLAVLFFGSWQLKVHPMELAVVQGDSIPVRIGTQETDTLRFELFSGDRVYIDTVQGEYCRIETANGDRGWVKAQALTSVWPPEGRK